MLVLSKYRMTFLSTKIIIEIYQFVNKVFSVYFKNLKRTVVSYALVDVYFHKKAWKTHSSQFTAASVTSQYSDPFSNPLRRGGLRAPVIFSSQTVRLVAWLIVPACGFVIITISPYYRSATIIVRHYIVIIHVHYGGLYPYRNIRQCGTLV